MATRVKPTTNFTATLRTQFVLLVFSLVICEIGLRALAASPLGPLFEPVPLWLSDPVLRFRGNPRYPDHDARGYRNHTALSRADIVTIGDSHTYGIGVKREEAWPALLSASTGQTVYSMAHGGYGPGQYERLLAEALTLRPRVVVVGLFMGNDFFDAYAFAKGRPTQPQLAQLAARAAALDEKASIEEQAARQFSLGRVSGLRAWLGEHVRLYRFAYDVRQRLTRPKALFPETFDTAVAALPADARRYVSVVNGPEWRTILRAPYGRLGLDEGDARILLGFELTISALESISSRCRAERLDLVVVVLPTKESVFWPRISDPDRHPQLRALVEDEAAFRTHLIVRLREAHIVALDVLPALRAATAQPYPETLDGHPNPAGHRIIARQLAGWILDHPRN